MLEIQHKQMLFTVLSNQNSFNNLINISPTLSLKVWKMLIRKLGLKNITEEI